MHVVLSRIESTSTVRAGERLKWASQSSSASPRLSPAWLAEAQRNADDDDHMPFHIQDSLVCRTINCKACIEKREIVQNLSETA